MEHETPLMLLPGLMNDARVWDPVRAAWPPGRDVVVAPTHHFDSVAATASAAIAAMTPGAFAVAGFSLGGYVALEVCRQAPERVAGLALLDTGARADSDDAKAGRRAAVAALGSGQATFAQVAGSFASRLLHASHLDDVPLRNLLSDMARGIGSDGFVRQQTAATNRPDSRELLPTLRVPALVLCGEDDQVTPVALSREMTDLLPAGAELVVVPTCGHMATLEQPAAVAAALAQWLATVDAGR